jgi:uncharacterized iron-regulated membrane protein
MRFPKLTWRRLHAWTLTLLTLPILLISVTGVALHLKKEVRWIQPYEQRGEARPPALSLQDVLTASRAIPAAGVREWEDVARVDFRPEKSLIKVLSRENWELQLDAASGALLSSAPRNSDWLESLHDGSWFHGSVKFGVFLTTGLLLAVGALTGLYLFLLPLKLTKRRGRAAVSGRPSLATAAQQS